MKLSSLFQVPQIERLQKRNGFAFFKREQIAREMPTSPILSPKKKIQARQINPNIQKKIIPSMETPQALPIFRLRQRKI